MMKAILFCFLTVSLLSQTQEVRPDFRTLRLVGVIEVGEVFEDCSHVRKSGRAAETPIGFMVTPDSAFKITMDKIKFRCPSPFGNTVFADNDYYYITVGPVDMFFQPVKQDITSGLLRAKTYRVHGLTGTVLPPTSFN